MVKTLKKQYGLIGATYMGVYEFGDRIEGRDGPAFRPERRPESPHFFDQAQLLAAGKFKRELFYWDDVLAGAVAGYHPGAPLSLAKKDGEGKAQ